MWVAEIAQPRGLCAPSYTMETLYSYSFKIPTTTLRDATNAHPSIIVALSFGRDVDVPSLNIEVLAMSRKAGVMTAEED